MHLNDQKEQFSLAFVHAVASRAGYQVEIPTKDRNSVDGRVLSDTEIIEFQAKATSQQIESDGVVSFRLPKKNYNDLRDTRAMALRLLVVVQVPNDPGEWIDQSDEQLCLTSWGVWKTLRGAEEIDKESVTVKIPSSNRFNFEGLEALMGQARVLHSSPGG